MIVDEGKAWELYCPNSMNAVEGPFKCKGPRCMGWRGLGDGKGYCGVGAAPVSVLVDTQRVVMGEMLEKQAADAQKRMQQFLTLAAPAGNETPS